MEILAKFFLYFSILYLVQVSKYDLSYSIQYTYILLILLHQTR